MYKLNVNLNKVKFDSICFKTISEEPKVVTLRDEKVLSLVSTGVPLF